MKMNLTKTRSHRGISSFYLVLLCFSLFGDLVKAQTSCDPTAEFSYDASAYCQNANDPVLSHSTGSDGVYTATVVSGGPSLALTPTTGVIDLSASDAGIYTITNTVTTSGGSGTLLIAGVIDGPLSGGVPKAVEFYALNAIADLSLYGFGSANNGGGSDGQEFTFPAVAVPAGAYIWVASEAAGFNTFFGFNPDYTSNAASINGDDAIELFFNGAVIDVFGDINQDGTGQPWEYMDGWAYRINNTGPDGSTFLLANWTFSGPNALDGETSNATAVTPWPISTYAAGTSVSCSQTMEIVAPPTSEAGPNQLVCENDLVALAAIGAGTWSGGVGVFSDVNDPNASYTPAPTEAGTSVALTWAVAATGGGVCVNATDDVNITILSTSDAEFSYDADTYCPNGPNPVPAHTTGTDGLYTYTVVSGGPTLALDGQTGAIGLSLSDRGQYEITNTISGCGNLVISGVIDGPLSGGVPKAVEFYALADIPDLSAYGFGSANNGGGSDGEEFTFPPDAIAKGTHIWVATQSSSFVSFFGVPPTYINTVAPSINGDDAIELFCHGAVIDVFGEINQDGTGQPWEYMDGWAYRVDNTGPDAAFFEFSSWAFSGPNALDGETSNSTAATPFPIQSFSSNSNGTCADVSHTVTLTIDDTEAPFLLCPDDAFVTAEPGLCEAVVIFAPTVLDNCDPAPAVVQTNQTGYASGEFFPIGQYLIELEASDQYGNTANCSFTINVLDFPNPTATLSCNDQVQASLDANGQAVIGADMILEGGPYSCYDNYDVVIYNANMDPIGNTLTCGDIGTTFTVKVTGPVTGNSCWGQITAEDKLPPILQCSDRDIHCSANVNAVPPPLVSDNCDTSPDLSMTGLTLVDNDACDDDVAKYRREWVATDASGNETACVEFITIHRAKVVNFPNDIVWHCEQNGAYPGITQASPLHPGVVDTDPTDYDVDVDGALPGNVLANTGSGIPTAIDGQFCQMSYTFQDEIVEECGVAPGVFKIKRTWTVIDWCSLDIITAGFDDVNGNEIQDPGEEDEDNIQIIRVADLLPPVITAADVTVSANLTAVYPNLCSSTEVIALPTVTDNCTGVGEYHILTSVGEAIDGVIPAPGLPLGVHTVNIWAADNCGNTSQTQITVTVVDDVAPVAVCDEITNVNLSSDGVAEVFAETFDDGSYDNCCFDHFEVRKMTDNCDDGVDNTVFGPSVSFCCDDVANNPVMVVFRAVDCFDNYGECMVQVNVLDKQKPILVTCPAPERITCDFYAQNLETALAGLSQDEQSQYLDQFFGAPAFADNCDLTLNRTLALNIDQCLEGTISRSWVAEDNGGNTSGSCQQVISVDHVSDWVVEFPANQMVTCGTEVPEFGEPKIFFETCELVAISYEDEYFNVVPDACYKILRTWTIINWCVVGADIDEEVVEQPENQLGLPFPQCDLDGDGDCDDRTYRDSWNATSMPAVANATDVTGPDTDLDSDPWDGYITHQQVIKVIDEVEPVFTVGCLIADVCILDNTCAASVTLQTPLVDDCSTDVTITASSDLGEGFGPFAGVVPGVYDVIYHAIDNCNNQTFCNATVTVKDCKNPVPYCKTGLVTTLMNTTPPMIEVWASDLNEASFDNCEGELQFSFSPDVNDDSFVFTCDNIGGVLVNIWVTDAAGNQDYCQTLVGIEDNMPVCGTTDPLISMGGAITNEDNESLQDVEMHLSGSSSSVVMTDAGGIFEFADVPLGGDYTLLPIKDAEPLNGVSTFDLVLITKHILGVQLLDSPYKIIAADVNKSNSVTTFDLVELRKLILFINTEFPNNTSWRFVDKDFVFPNPANPFEFNFPELLNFNNVASSVLDANFIGLKVGDVNGSAIPNQLLGNEDRTTSGTFIFQLDDLYLEKGVPVTVDFIAPADNVEGFQFTLEFDKRALDFTNLFSNTLTEDNFGLTMLDDGLITASWNKTDDEAFAPELSYFTITFKPRENVRLRDAIHLNSRFTKAEAYTTDLELQNVALSFGNDVYPAEFGLFQNAPNPFGRFTVIGFNLPEAADASLTILDISGRVVKSIRGEYAKGYNEITISREDLPAAQGVYYYRFETENFTATRKMILLD
jgi:HYR domain-containing protein